MVILELYVSVVSFKVNPELKDKIRKYKDKVNWADELRRFVEERIREIEADENIKRVMEELKSIPAEVPKGFSVKMVRKDRDSH